MATGGDIAKAGWLYRLSSVLRRWKRNWFVLYRDGDLKYFESPDHPRAEERIVVRAWVSSIRMGPDCTRVDPPEGFSHHAKNCFLELLMSNREPMLLCAESFDDMRAWQIALEEARLMPGFPRNSAQVYMPPPGVMTYTSPYYGVTQYPGYTFPPSQTTVVHGAPGNSTTTIVAPPAQQVVYMDDYPHRYRYYRGGLFGRPLLWW